MQININLEKRYMYLVLATIVFLAGAIVTVAYNPTDTPPAVPSTMGHTVNEIENFEQEVTAIIQDAVFGGTVNCGNPIWESDLPNLAAKGILAYTLPSACISLDGSAGCVIRQEVYYNSSKLKKLKFTRQYDFYQTSLDSSNLWWSNYQTSGDKKNGDSNNDRIIPTYNGLEIKDDYGTTVEKLANQISLRDSTSSYGMKVYICTEAPVT